MTKETRRKPTRTKAATVTTASEPKPLYSDIRTTMPKHLVQIQDVSPTILYEIFQRARRLEEMEAEKEYDDSLLNRSVIFIHDQPSSRTIESYAEATKDLGGDFRSVFTQGSSMEKGESLAATVMTYATIGKDIVIIRHSDEGAIYRAAVKSDIPLINAGSSSEQHPSQAILDAKTMFDHNDGTLEGISVMFMGNIAESRVVNSLIYLLGNYSKVRIYTGAPESMWMKGDLRWHLHKRQLEGRIQIVETTDPRRYLKDVQFLYITRDYKELSQYPERLGDLSHLQLTWDIMDKHPNLLVMHPLPHNNELPTELEDHPRVLIREQMRNGKFTRQAWLQMLALYHLK